MTKAGKNEKAERAGKNGKNGRNGRNERAESSDFFSKKVFKFLSIEKNLLTCDHNI